VIQAIDDATRFVLVEVYRDAEAPLRHRTRRTTRSGGTRWPSSWLHPEPACASRTSFPVK
jgi:quinol monooxygenase YgiN